MELVRFVSCSYITTLPRVMMPSTTTAGRVPYDILSVLCDTLDAKVDAQTLSAFSIASSTFHRAAVPFLFRQLELSANIESRKRVSFFVSCDLNSTEPSLRTNCRSVLRYLFFCRNPTSRHMCGELFKLVGISQITPF